MSREQAAGLMVTADFSSDSFRTGDGGQPDSQNFTDGKHLSMKRVYSGKRTGIQG